MIIMNLYVYKTLVLYELINIQDFSVVIIIMNLYVFKTVMIITNLYVYKNLVL